jgi:hypothetical protein
LAAGLCGPAAAKTGKIMISGEKFEQGNERSEKPERRRLSGAG